jgi:4-hydroxyphenylpyruvate dioxygenase
MSAPIQRLLGFEYFVRDLERTGGFYARQMGFSEVGRSRVEHERVHGQRSRLFRAGETLVICSAPLAEGARASRYLSRHPEGIGALVFEVADAGEALTALERAGATPTGEIRTFSDDRGSSATFSIATPLGDVQFDFVERRGRPRQVSGIEIYDIQRALLDEPGFAEIDHVTANFRTMKPALLWLEHVMGWQPFWGVEFHTSGLEQENPVGSGLRSRVMWDPATGIKLACNEPLRPSFEKSQISLFCDDNRGDGIQHVALGVRNILHTVRGLHARGVKSMPAPALYHRRLPQHLRRLGIEGIDEELGALEELGILVDGSGRDAYLLQVFLEEAARTFSDPSAGPFFFELIERKGDTGFGAGNFRALFDSVEGQQLARTA